MRFTFMPNPLLLLAALPLLAAAPTVAAMKHARRVLIVAAPSAADTRLAAQRHALDGWQQGAADRDISLVEIAGDRVRGAGDKASDLRAHWHLPPGEFQVVLIGKDGHEALRRATPLPADALRETIDAMPMRRAGLR